MKKLLSLILAIAMIATFIPAVSANETVDATNNMKIVYEFLGQFDGLSSNNMLTYVNNVGYDSTNGFFDLTAISGKNSNFNGQGSVVRMQTGAGITLKIRVPADGEYTVAAAVARRTAVNGNKISMVVKDSLNTERLKVTDISADAYTNSSTPDPNNTITFGKVTLEEGEYTVVLTPTTATSCWIAVRNITLTAGEGMAAPFIKEYTAPKSEIAVGESATMSVDTAAVLSDATVAEGVSVSYSSSKKDIATVNSEGKITGVADGTVEITATVSATNCDHVVTKTATVKVGTGESLPQDEITIKYDFAKSPTGSNGVVQYWYTYDKTNGFFAHKSHEENSCNGRALDGTLRIQRGVGTGDYMDFEIEVPKSGDYTVYADWRTHNANVSFDVLVGADEDALTNVANLGATTAAVERTGVVKLNDAKVHLDAGKNLIRLQIPEGFTNTGSSDGWLVIYSFSLVAGSADAIVGGEINLPDKISLGEEENAEAVGYLSSTGAAASFTYESDDESVVKVNGTTGAIETVGIGSATITATCADALSGYNTISKRITVAAPEAPKAPTVSFYAESTDNTETPITITATDADGNAVVPATAATLNRGTNVTVTAPEKSGYLFVGWFRGSKENGRFVWADNEYSFAAMTHTMLTAVYEAAPEKAYYNFNGEFLGTSEPASNPTMLGYEFVGWNEAVYNNLTRLVAKYAKKDTTYNVEIPQGVSVEKDEADYYYDTKVILTSNTDVTWLRNGKPVEYGKTYTFYVWDDVKITTDAAADTAPKVILDSSKSGEYMIEYDAGDKTVIEKGIIFGTDADITIESCGEKMNSQRSEAHGQFSAESDYACARGYLIYEDGGEYKVIYSSAE